MGRINRYMPTRVRGIVSLCLAAAAAGWFALTWQRAHAPLSEQPTTPPPARIAEPAAAPAPPPRVDVELVFREDVVPVLARFEQRNQAAVDAALADVKERLDGRRWGITPFVKDVNAWGTKFRVIGKSANDFWQTHWHKRRDAAEVKAFVDGKFRHHVLSEQALESDLSASLAGFREAIEASRNQLYVDLRLPLENISTPAGPATAPAAELADYRRRVEEQAKHESGRLGQAFAGDTVVQGVNSLLVTTVAAEVSQRIVSGVVANVLTRVGTQLATRTVAAGGATAAGAVTGGGGGTLAGPAGTVVGVAVGLTVGVVIDVWMSKKFEERMTHELHGYFDSVTKQLLEGNNANGLKSSLAQSVTHLNTVQREAVHRALLETAQP
jgi:hypothetical protein